MDGEAEAAVLRLLEGALAQEPAARLAWLAEQGAPPACAARVRELLANEEALTRFLEHPPGVIHAAAAVAGPAAGDRVGAWKLLRRLDAGGMGVVFLAERSDGSYEQQAAIKFVRTDLLLPDERHRAELVERFAYERRLLARLDHPNIARILDGGSTPEGWPYLVMEYIDGVALDAWCDRQRLGVAARIALFCRVCEGVQAAHRHLIVHRDLKPQNILVGADGEPRLLDFGIARLLDPAAPGSGVQTGVSAMTPAYASPEQLRMEPLTTASDIYSLGVVLYELLAGVRPHALEGLSPAQGERLVCDSRPPPLRRAIAQGSVPLAERRARLARIGGDLERIVAKALHLEPARRYGSAHELAEDLRRCLDGRPVLAHPDSLRYRATKFIRRHRLGTAAAVLALAAIVGASTLALVKARQAVRAAADTELVNAFLVDVLEESSPYASGDEPTLGEALDDAAARVDQRFRGRPDLAVDVRNALGESMFSRYRLEPAAEQLLRARSEGERLFGPDDARTVRAIATLASVRKDQDRNDEAQALFDDALHRLERSGQTGLPLYASVLNDVGVMHLIQEDFATAENYLQRALDADSGSSEPSAVEDPARPHANQAQAARGQGPHDRADALYRKAQPVLEQLYPDGGPHLAVILNNRARLAWVRGDREGAIALQKQAVEMHRRSFTGDHVMVLVPMTNLARQALETGKLELAEEWGAKAAAMADRLYPERSHHYHVNALATLAGIRLAQGRVAEAAGLLQRARRLLAGLESAPSSTRDYVGTLVARTCANAAAAAAPPCTGNG